MARGFVWHAVLFLNKPLCVPLCGSSGKSTASNQAVADAVEAGIPVAVAAGNEASDACGTSPASEPLAYTVGSTTVQDR